MVLHDSKSDLPLVQYTYRLLNAKTIQATDLCHVTLHQFPFSSQPCVTLVRSKRTNNETFVQTPLIDLVHSGKKYLRSLKIAGLISACKSTFQNSGYFQNHYFFRFEIYPIFSSFEPEFFSGFELKIFQVVWFISQFSKCFFDSSNRIFSRFQLNLNRVFSRFKLSFDT